MTQPGLGRTRFLPALDRLLHTPGAALVRQPRHTPLISDRDLALPSDREGHPPNTANSRCQLFPTHSRGGVSDVKANDKYLEGGGEVPWDGTGTLGVATEEAGRHRAPRTPRRVQPPSCLRSSGLFCFPGAPAASPVLLFLAAAASQEEWGAAVDAPGREPCPGRESGWGGLGSARDLLCDVAGHSPSPNGLFPPEGASQPCRAGRCPRVEVAWGAHRTLRPRDLLAQPWGQEAGVQLSSSRLAAAAGPPQWPLPVASTELSREAAPSRLPPSPKTKRCHSHRRQAWWRSPCQAGRWRVSQIPPPLFP